MRTIRRLSEPQRAPSRRSRIAAGTGAALLLAVGAMLVQAPNAHAASSTTSGGWIRFGHFATGNGPVKVAINGTTVATNVRFETVTPYEAVAAGTDTVTISATGSHAFSRSEKVDITVGEAVTVGALREPQGVELHQFRDNLSAAPAGMAKIRLVDTASTERMISIRLVPTNAQTTAAVLSATSTTSVATSITDVDYGSASSYVDVRAGSYGVAIDNQSGKAIVTGHGWPVKAGTVASLVVLQTSTGPTLEVLRDAAGTVDAPVGGMETGYGGTAGHGAGSSLTADPGRLALDAGLVLVGLLLVGGTLVLVSRRQRGRTTVAAVAAVTAVVLVAAGCGGTSSHSTSAPAPKAAATHKAAPTPKTPEAPTTKTHSSKTHSTKAAAKATNINLAGSSTGAPTTTASAPTAITIPSIGVHTSVIRLGRNADGTAEVPATTAVVGWYTDGPEPGQPGPAVILGHVDSYKGPGVFFDLKDVKPGALVQVTEKTRTVTFAVQTVDIYSKTAFPTEAVYGPVPDRALRLVTCGGPFDSATGHYLDNVVAYAVEVSSAPMA